MATVNNPLLSVAASGTIGKETTYSSWKGRPYAKKYTRPRDPRTDAQLGYRAHFKGSVAAYQALSVDMQAQWSAEGERTRITGLNAMNRVSSQNRTVGRGIQQRPTTSTTTSPAPPTALTAAVSGRQVLLAWTPSPTPNAFLTYLYRSATPGVPPGNTTLKQVVPQAIIQALDNPGLGTWYYQVVCDSADGYLSLPSSEIMVMVRQ